MNRDDVIKTLLAIAPPDGAEEFDFGKIGLIIEGSETVDRVCTALDLTSRVVTQAIEMGAQMIVVHHTPIWYPLTSITGVDAVLFRSVLHADINVFVMHTNYDVATGGVNDTLAEMLSLTNTIRMSIGVIGDCNLSTQEISKRLGGGIRIFGVKRPISRLAVAGGSCFDSILINEAFSLGADAFLSAELRHSVARASPILLIESTHYQTEAPAMQVLATKMGWTYIDDPPLWYTVNVTR